MPASSRGTTARGKKPIVPPGRGRRSQAARAEIAKQESERLQAREAQYAEQQRLAAEQQADRGNRGRGGRGGRARGRGGRGGFMGEPQAPSGPFSAGSVIRSTVDKAYPRPWSSNQKPKTFPIKQEDSTTTGGAGASSSSRGRDTAGTSRLLRNSRIKTRVDLSDDDDSDAKAPRKDVDFVNLLSDDDMPGSSSSEREEKPRPPAGSSRLRSHPLFSAPIRVPRIEHRFRAPQINADATAVKAKKTEIGGSRTLDEIAEKRTRQLGGAGRPWRGVYDDDEDEDAQEGGDDVVMQEAESDNATALRPAKTEKGATKGKTPLSSLRKKPQTFQTEEDRLEWEREEYDRRTLVAELASVGLVPGDGGDSIPENTEGEQVDNKADRVYLFQFPPVIPDLKPIEAIKLEPEQAVDPTAGEDPRASASISAIAKGKMPVQSAAHASSPSSKRQQQQQPQQQQQQQQQTRAQAGTAGSAPQTAIDLSSTAPDKASKDPQQTLFPPRPDHLPHLASGRVGKLRIYKSGKAALDWGGTSLQLNMGMNPAYLQDSVLVRMGRKGDGEGGGRAGGAGGSGREAAKNSKSGGEIAGEALSFGQVRGKFVVTPDWEEMLGGI